jgi:hypothetical protein
MRGTNTDEMVAQMRPIGTTKKTSLFAWHQNLIHKVL